MKKIINAAMAFLSVLFLAFGIFSETAKAIDPDSLCTPCDSCEEFHKPFSGSYSYHPDPDSVGHELWAFYDTLQQSYCYFDISFKIRTCYCPDERMEIFIEKIELSEGCSGYDYETILAECIKALVKNTPLIFDMDPYPADGWDVAVMYNKCWEFDSSYMVPCTTVTECCKTRYWVTNTQNGAFITEKQREIPIGPPCSSPINQDCFDYCDANDLSFAQINNSVSGPFCADICPETDWDDLSVYFPNNPNEYLFSKTFRRVFSAPEDHIIAYVSTKKCNGWNYIRIDRIALSHSMPYITNAEILLQAIRGALWRANGYFREYLNDSLPYFRSYNLIISSCWQRIMNGRQLVPCEDASCCYARYDIKQDTNQIDSFPEYRKRVIGKYYNYSPDSCIAPCTFECNILNYGGLIGLLPRVSIENEHINTNNDITNNKISIRPNPADESFTVDFTTTSESQFEIQICNIDAEVLFQDTKLINGNNLWKVDSRKWANGTYFINIIQNNKLIISEKIIINK